MPKVAKGRRIRAYRPKTRSGCLTCRIRRIKCDEALPACLRCTSSRRVCDGYSHVTAKASHPPPMVHVSVTTGPVFDSYISPREERSFMFFVQHTSRQQAGFFGSDFWERFVPQAAHHEPAIRHAAVALGSLHELYERGTATIEDQNTFALEQYSLAIRELLKPLSLTGERGVDVCLISCILFICFENMQGHHTLAGSHIQSGVKLLCETVYDQQSGLLQHEVLGSRSRVNTYAPLEVLARIFAGLDSQSSEIIRDYKHNIFEKYLSSQTDYSGSLSFSSIEKAKSAFEYGMCLFSSSRVDQPSCDPVNSPNAIGSNLQYFETLLLSFSSALQQFIKLNYSTFTRKEEVAMALLQLHALNIYIYTVSRIHQSCGDIFVPQMREMVALAEKIVSSTSDSDHLGGQSMSFCLDLGFIIPLYTVASQCQDPIIRGNAIRILRSTPRQEGLWNSFLIADVAERIMEIQASTPGAQPMLLLDGQGGRLKYVRQEPGVYDQLDVVENVFSW